MTTIFKLVGILFLFVLGAFAVMFFMTYVLGAFVFFGAFAVVLWGLGVPITVKSNGKKIGYYRWTTFYPTRKF